MENEKLKRMRQIAISLAIIGILFLAIVALNLSKNEEIIIFCFMYGFMVFMAFNIFKLAKSDNIDMKNTIETLNKLQEDLERKNFIQDMLNHANMETEINEKMAYVNKIIEKYNDSPDGYYYRGEFYIKFEKFYAAIRDFEKTIEIDENYKEAYRGKGVCYSRLGDNALAIKNYQKALEIDQNYEVAYYNLGVSYSNLKEYDKALVSYSQALELDENDVSAYYNRGRIFAYLGRYKEALKDFTNAINLEIGRAHV